MEKNSIDSAAIASELNLAENAVVRTIELLDQGNEVPFITRYRKDQTGGLDGDQIRGIQLLVGKHRQLNQRRNSILKSVRGQNRLSDELKQQIEAADSLRRLEDLYLPFKPKKKSLAQTAASRGLGVLANEILSSDAAAADLTARALAFVDSEKQLHSINEVLQGVCHIIAEKYSENAETRQQLREIAWNTGQLASTYLPPVDGSAQADTNKNAAADKPSEPKQSQTQNPPEESTSDASPTNDGSSPTANTTNEQQPPNEAAETAALTPEKNEPTDSTNIESPAPPEELADSEATSEAPPEPTTSGEAHVVEPADQAPAAEATETTPAETVAGGDDTPQVPATTESPPTPAEDAVPDVGFVPKVVEAPPAPPKKASQPQLSRAQQIKAAKKAAKQKKRKRLEQALREYFDFRESVNTIKPHQLLALNRGDRFRVVRVRLECDQEALQKQAEESLLSDEHPHNDFLKTCVRDALNRLIFPSLEREIRRELTDNAEAHAIEVFGKNLRMLLLQPPVEGRSVLAIDPGFRSGSKLAAIDQYGNVLGYSIIHVIGREERVKQGREEFVSLIQKHNISAIAIGNGAGSRETERLVASILADELKDSKVEYAIVNSAGASVYSTSPLGREELAGIDPVLRSAVSIGRRLQDPLSELVKISPANIGVGLYQHDVKASHLQETLDGVVEDCVNHVGVDVNSASPSLLGYVAGLNQLTARRIFEHRTQKGPFKNREELKEIQGLGEVTWKQSAGFLKINHGDNPLDATWIHPESYESAAKVLDSMGLSTADVPTPEAPQVDSQAQFGGELLESGETKSQTDSIRETTPAECAAQETPAVAASPTAAVEVAEKPKPREPSDALKKAVESFNITQSAESLGIGQWLLRDILANLIRPGRDPRDELPAPHFRRGVMKLSDLSPGMQMIGTVLNVVDFGVFVDIGLSDSGLVHISRLANRFIKDPHEVVSVGDVLNLWVESVDSGRRRVSLTAIAPGTQTQQPAREERKPRSRHKKKEGDRPPRSRGKKGANPKRTDRPRKPKPVTPITKEMKEGKAPMRSFSDLQQFFQQDDKGDKKDKK